VKRADPLTPAQRSSLMGKVRGKGNASTEQRVEVTLKAAGLCGWIKHPPQILGKPDFYFPEFRTAVFVDGCFWHACPQCSRRTPKTRRAFWESKIEDNRLRDNRVRRKLRQLGIHCVRVWEHEAPNVSWLRRLRLVLERSRPVPVLAVAERRSKYRTPGGRLPKVTL
jgi:DNA mismatch endonuclease (patch repair protein)